MFSTLSELEDNKVFVLGLKLAVVWIEEDRVCF